MKNSLLKEAMRIAEKTLSDHPQYSCYMHWSFAVQRNQLLGYATNDCGEAPIHLGYQQRVSWASAKRHAEWNVWRKVKGILTPEKPFEIINIRLNKRGQIRASAPCSCCFNFLKSLNCSHCYFTTDSGLWAKTIF